MSESGPANETEPLPGGSTGREPEAALVHARVVSRLLGEDPLVTRVGRFRLLERVGQGGMGTVWAAYDPDLDRKVAVKLLRATGSGDSIGRRIVREAQAMAKLSHPNVAQIYEVGEHQGDTFIAMEFVRGETLRVWQGRPRSQREIVDAYLQAGRGLAAAHAVGLVHRDFKPDNAMIGRDGRVRVLDFGLARTAEPERSDELELHSLLPPPADDALGTPLTHGGARMGTPAYMAPEQFLGEEVTPKTDQFAFCVALWEALAGERPFAGNSHVELLGNVTRGRLREPPKAQRLPPWLRSVLVRGLSVSPAERFASTEALLAALGRDPSRRRRRVAKIGAGLLGAAALVGAVEGMRTMARVQATDACATAGAEIDGVWHDEARARVQAALLGTGLGYAERTVAALLPLLDAQAHGWRAQRVEACMQATVHGGWSAELFDRATWCLDERRLELASLVARLEQADRRVAASAVTTALRLTPVAPCGDAVTLAALPPPPEPATRERATALRGALAQAKARLETGEPRAAIDEARTARIAAEQLGWPPLTAAAWLVEGLALDETGAFAEAEAALVSAYTTAVKVRDWETATQAAIQLIHTVGFQLARPDAGAAWAVGAESMAALAGDPLRLHESRRLQNLGSLERAAGRPREALALHERALVLDEQALGPDHMRVAGALSGVANDRLSLADYDGALPLYERSVAIYEAVLGPDHPTVAVSINNLANAYFRRGEYDRARALNERALAIRERADGPDSPNVAMSLLNLSNVLSQTGDYAGAKPLCARALAIYERTLGPAHPETAGAMNNLAMVAHSLHDYGEARALHARALAIRERHYGAEHPDVARSLNNLANAHVALGEHAQARDLQVRALGIRERTLGAEHPDVARSLSNLANAHAALGANAEAEPLHRRALAIRERALGPDHPDVAFTLLGLGRVTRALGRTAEAVELLERAVAIRERADVPSEQLAAARFELAETLWAADRRHRPRAVELARAAGDALRASGRDDELLASIDAWLASRRAR